MKRYKVSEVAEMIGVPKQTVYQFIRDGNLRAQVMKGYKRGYRITEEDLKQWEKNGWKYV